MKRTILLLLTLFVPMGLHAQWPNCSYATMTADGTGYSCPVTAPAEQLHQYPATGSNTWLDQCWELYGAGTPYYSQASTVNGNGACMLVRSTWFQCPPSNETEIVPATTEGGSNTMYNRMYDVSNQSNTVLSCPKTGGFHQDIRYCAAVFCAPNCCNSTAYVCPNRYLCVAGDAGCECEFASPIIIDTTGRGFHLTNTAGGVMFDMGGTGHLIRISWTAATSSNAFLVLDRKHNGKIDGKDLFGNLTEQPKSDDPNGYLALAVFDKPENGGNGDGIIDSRDAVFSKLQLWIDANHDGISQPNELHSLPELGVYSISLRYKEDRYEDVYGNWFHYKAALNPNPLDGTSRDGRWTYDVFLLPAKGSTTANCPGKANPKTVKAWQITEPK